MCDMPHSSTLRWGSEASEQIYKLQVSFTEIPVLLFGNHWACWQRFLGSVANITGLFVTWLIHLHQAAGAKCQNREYRVVWHDSFICETWPIHMCDIHDSFIRATWLDHRNHSWTWGSDASESCVACRVTRRTHMCDVTDSYVWHDSLICVTGRTHLRDKDSFIYTDLRERRVRIVSSVSRTSCRENGSRTLDRAKRCTTRLFSATIELRKVALRCTHDTASASSPCATIIPLEEKKGKRAPEKNYIARLEYHWREGKYEGGDWWQQSVGREIQGASSRKMPYLPRSLSAKEPYN